MTMIRPRSDVVYGICRGLPSDHVVGYGIGRGLPNGMAYISGSIELSFVPHMYDQTLASSLI